MLSTVDARQHFDTENISQALEAITMSWICRVLAEELDRNELFSLGSKRLQWTTPTYCFEVVLSPHVQEKTVYNGETVELVTLNVNLYFALIHYSPGYPFPTHEIVFTHNWNVPIPGQWRWKIIW